MFQLNSSRAPNAVFVYKRIVFLWTEFVHVGSCLLAEVGCRECPFGDPNVWERIYWDIIAPILDILQKYFGDPKNNRIYFCCSYSFLSVGLVIERLGKTPQKKNLQNLMVSNLRTSFPHWNCLFSAAMKRGMGGPFGRARKPWIRLMTWAVSPAKRKKRKKSHRSLCKQTCRGIAVGLAAEAAFVNWEHAMAMHKTSTLRLECCWGSKRL